MTPYTFNQHKHNYATWTAARAVQRNFTKTAKIKTAIEKSDLRQFAESHSPYSADEFDTFHKTCSQQLITAFIELDVPKVSYGRVAKIISIYLKTSVILCNNGECNRSKVIHPPIDNILLMRLSKFEKLKHLKTTTWTTLDEEKYWNLVSTLRANFEKFDWTLEEYWTPERDY